MLRQVPPHSVNALPLKKGGVLSFIDYQAVNPFVIF